MNSSQSAGIAHLLDRPIAYHRIFVTLLKTLAAKYHENEEEFTEPLRVAAVLAAIMLSQAMYWTIRATLPDGWFYKTSEEWEEETGMTRREQDTARRCLRRYCSWWSEQKKGLPGKMHYRIDMDALAKDLSSLAQCARLNWRSAPNNNGSNGHDSLLECALQYKGNSEITSNIKTTTCRTLREEVSGGADTGSRDLIDKLLTETLLRGADSAKIARAAKKYKRTFSEVEIAVDVLDQQYRRSKRKIENPTALILCALMDGLDTPKGYIAKAQRKAEAEQKRGSSGISIDVAAIEAETKAYRDADKRLSELTEEDRAEIYIKAKSNLPTILRDSPMAVKSEAIKLMLTR